MSKRRAGNELTRDNWDDEEEKVEAGTFQVANESVLKNRIVKKAKRMLQRDESGEIKPIFSGFSGFNNMTNNTNTKQAFSFLSKCSETPSESGNHPSASTINSMTTSTSLAFPENTCAKSSSQTIVNPVKVMKLNEAFVKFITDAVQKNPYCVLTPTLKDYEKQVNKFVTLSGSKTNTFDLSMTSKGSPQVSSYENTEIRLKDKDEVENNTVNIKENPTSFTNPKSNTNNGSLFKFGDGNTVTNVNDTSNSNLKIEDINDKDKEEKIIEPKSQLVSIEESKNKPITSGGFKLGDFKFNPQSFSIPLSSTSSESVFNDQKTPPFKNTEIKSNSTPFNFGTVPTFSFKPMEQQNDNNKPFFSFGSKLATVTSNSDTTKVTETQKSKDEEDEDQPPVVNFTPIKENDAIFEAKSKLYCLKNSKYEELGIGQLYLKQVDDKKIQLIMRNDNALGTIMINTLLNESINFTKRNTKTVQLICILDPTKSTKPQTVLFKFKDPQITDSFENELNKLKK